jgi:hypothetical protein
MVRYGARVAAPRPHTRDFTHDARVRLGIAVTRAREVDHGYRPSFAEVAGFSVRSLIKLEQGVPVGPKVYEAAARALPGWTEDTPVDILNGGPIPPTAKPAKKEKPPREHAAEDRTWMRTLSEEEFLDYIEFIRAKRGATAALKVMREIVEERERSDAARRAASTEERGNIRPDLR